MKIAILTSAILLTAAFGINQPTFAATRSGEKVTAAVNAVSSINKIEVRGNVVLYVSDGLADQVKVYGDDYKGSALVPDKDGVLRITSNETQKLVIWVTVSDLRNMSVYDNAEVRSFGTLSAIELDVKLYNNAFAKLNLDACQANITLNDRAKAELSGNVSEAELKYDRSTSVDITNLASASLVKTENFEGIASNHL